MRRSRFLLSLALFVFVFGSFLYGLAQEELLKQVDAYVKKAQTEWSAPAVAVSIVKDDRVIFAKGYGVINAKKGTPVDELTLFAIGSSSKAFTVASVGMLKDEGKLDWDDRASKYLPDLQLFDPWVTRELRIRDMLSHKIGIERSDLLWYGTDYSRDEILHRLRYIPHVISFRYRYGYNNLMFLAAGQIVAALSGKSWDSFVKERIFKPLGMNTSSTSTLDLEKSTNVATPHAYVDGKAQAIPWKNLDNVGPAGSINSNVMEMAQWVRLQLGKGTYGDKKLLNPETVTEMHSPQTVIPKGKWLSSISPVNHMMIPESHFFLYGLGWFLQDYHGRKIVHHGGSIDGMRCLVAMIPEENLGVVVLANINPTSLTESIPLKVFDLFLGTGEKDWSAEMLAGMKKALAKGEKRREEMKTSRAMGTAPSLELEKYAGLYENEAYGEAKIELKNSKLTFQIGKIVGPLSHWHYDTFVVGLPSSLSPGFMATFTLNSRGKVDELKLSGIGEFKRISDKKE